MRGQRVWKTSAMACTALAVVVSGLSVWASEKDAKVKPTESTSSQKAGAAQSGSHGELKKELSPEQAQVDQLILAFQKLQASQFDVDAAIALQSEMQAFVKANPAYTNSVAKHIAKLESDIDSPPADLVEPSGSVAGGGATCATALAVSDGSFGGSTVGDPNDVGDGPTPSCGSLSEVDDWYLYTATCNGCATIQTCNGTFEDSVVAVFTGCAGPQLACDDDGCLGDPAPTGPGYLSTLSMAVTSGTPYVIRVSGWGSAATLTSYTLDISCAPTVCGNGVVDCGEGCDDGANISGDGCSATCVVEGACCLPDGTCTPFITSAACTAIPGADWQGALSACGVCATCGDGIVGAGEQCDDGGTSNGDGCSSICTIEAPGNDTCATAEALTPLPDSDTESNVGATDDTTGTCVVSSPNQAIWYTVTGTGNTMTVTTDGSSYDTLLQVWCGTCASLICIDGDDDDGAGLQSLVTWCSEAGATYYVAAGGFGGGTGTTVTNASDSGVACVGAIACSLGVCGDGALNAGEACDDGNLINHDGCSSTCTEEGACCKIDGTCISNRTTVECSTAGGNYQGDNSVCVVGLCPACGDGIIEAPEQCDDGNTLPGDGCDGNCQCEAVVGVPSNDDCINRINVTDGSYCFDVDLATTDGIVEAVCNFPFGDDNIHLDIWYNYTATCTGVAVIDTCNGVSSDTRLAAYAGWACPPAGAPIDCDDDDDDSTNLCGGGLESVLVIPVTLGDQLKIRVGLFSATSTAGLDTLRIGCQTPACGNGTVEIGEECDDSNLIDGDGCDSNCTLTGCGNGILTAPEVCDDGNLTSGDGCDSNCTPTACGNGVVSAPETCDDGNVVSGDGCSSTCQFEVPGNDACAAALAVSVPGSGPVQSNAGATDDSQALCGTSAVNQGLWYTVLGNGNTITVTTCNAATNYDTKIQVWCDCPEFLCVGGNDDSTCSFSGLRSTVSFCSIPGHVYYVTVGGFSTATGNAQLDVTEDGLGCTPTVTCIPPVCGDGVTETPEQCDDGNLVSGDGCSATCQIEGACCNGSTCTLTTGTDCTTGGGNYQGDGSACGTQCVFGACCIGTSGLCEDVSADCCADQGGTFEGGTNCLSVDCPCNITCAPGKTVEGEADCGLPTDTVNGGCNSATFLTQPISCGQGYCGTAAFDGSLRDTDWYQIIIASDTLVTWTINAEFDPVGIIVNTSGGTNCTTPVIVASAAGEQCGAVTVVSACLTAGTYELFVGPDFTNIEACGAEYTATVTCGVCPAPPPAPADNCPATALGSLNSAGSVTGTLAGSTDNFAAPTGCGIPAACGAYGNGNDVIYEFTAGVSGNWTWSLCGSSPDWDSSIQIRSTGACPGTACVAADDDSCLSCSSPYEATITAALTSGTQYFVVVDSFSTGGSSNFNLSWSVAPVPTGACCGFPPAPNCSCSVQTEADCATAGGFYKGDGTTCGGNRCDCNTNGVCDQFDFQPSGGTPKGYSIDVIPDLAIPDAGVSPCGTCAVGQVCIDVNGDSIIGPAPDRCGVQTTFTVPDSGSITDVDVALDIIHTWEGDLIAIIEHGGVAVTLNAGLGGDGDLDGVYIFDDAASGTIHLGTGSIPPGSYKPDEVLALFNGLPKQGLWTLSFADDVGSDLGTLRAWSLAFINDGTPAVATDCNGDTIPDSCQLAGNDCNGNSIPDDCELAGNDVIPPGGDGKPDDCNCLVDGDCGPGQTCDPCTNVCVAGGCPCVTVADCKNTLCAFDNACNCATCTAGVCVFTCTGFGNVNCAGAVTLDDILCVLAGFGSFPLCPNGDIDPCGGNGIINLDDILKVLNAFGGGNPCGCLPAGVAPLCGSSSP